MAKTINLGKVGLTFEGDYDSSKNYASRTCVFYNHVSWASKKDVPAGIAPGTSEEYWQKVSERGAQGIQGERGPQGNSAFDGTGIELVNNLTQGGEASALSAEQGKILKSELGEVESKTLYIINKSGNISKGDSYIPLVNGKTYIMKGNAEVANPSSLAFQIIGQYEDGTAEGIYGILANGKKTISLVGKNYYAYILSVRQDANGTLSIAEEDSLIKQIEDNKDSISDLRVEFGEKADDIYNRLSDVIYGIRGSMVAGYYKLEKASCGKTYQVIADTDMPSELAFQIMSYINGSWVTSFGWTGKANKNITLPYNGTEFRLYVRQNQQGTLSIIEKDFPVVITANSDVESGANFVGNNAIKEAFSFIQDASEKKRYIIRATGEFYTNNVEDYEISNVSGISHVWINGKDYVDLDGGNNCIIRCELSDVISDIQEIMPSFTQEQYGWYQPIFWNYRAELKNITVITRNLRYPVHIDASGTTLLDDYDMKITNVRFIHEGKFGDSIGSIGGSANGFAVNKGASITFENCVFQAPRAYPYGHANKNFDRPGTINYKMCEWKHGFQKFDDADAVMRFECLSTNGVGSIMNVENSLLPEDVKVMPYMAVLDTEKRNADAICNIINIDSDPLAQMSGTISTRALYIKSKSTGENSSVRVDKNCSAFDAIWGYSNEVVFHENTKNCRRRQYGYEWKDGGGGMNGIAIGTRNVSQAKVNGTYENLLGKRLGDCSTNNKVLTIIIDGETYNVVFDKDYNGTSNTELPNFSNNQILQEIANIIGGVATVGTYNLDEEWMPNYKKGIEIRFCGDDTYVASGMGVVLLSNGKIRKAMPSDQRIDGICIDDVAPGDVARVVRSGKIAYSDARYCIAKADNMPNFESMEYGTLLSITENGRFGISSEYPMLKKLAGNAVKLL